MIELLGIGMTDLATGWLLRGLCAHIEPGVLTLVVSRQPSRRHALLAAVAGRRVPQEGRVWVNGVPVSPSTVRRLRTRVVEVELAAPLMERRSVLWNALAVAPRGLRTMRGCLRFPRRAVRKAAREALDIVRLGAYAQAPAALLTRRDRVHLRVARALVSRPECLLASEVDLRLSSEDARTILTLLRMAARDRSLVSLASVEDERLADEIGDRVVVLDADRPRSVGRLA